MGTALAVVERNCVMPMRICHHVAAPMQARGKGGIVPRRTAAPGRPGR
nr:hypothetical protein [Streptomyces sp. 846.5]